MFKQVGTRYKTPNVQFYAQDGLLYDAETDKPLMGESASFLISSQYNCSNNGVSQQYKELVIVGRGIKGNVTVKADQPFLQLVEHKITGHLNIDTKFAEPRNYSKDGRSHMNGGNFCTFYRCEETIGQETLRLHDRVE